MVHHELGKGIAMAKGDFQNYEERTPCVLVLDVSGSMNDKGAIDQLNEGLLRFKNEVMSDELASKRLEIGIVTFASEVKVLLPIKNTIEHVEMPVLKAGGGTKLVDGAQKGIDLVNHRKQELRDLGIPYKRPYVILITDGEPDSDQDIDGLSDVIKMGEDEKHFIFWAFGVDHANFGILDNLTHKHQAQKFTAQKFRDFFEWLSNSLSAVAKSTPKQVIDLRPKSDFFEHRN